MSTIINLWDNPPLMIEGKKSPTLHYYATDKKSENKSCVLLFAGGGYENVCVNHEGVTYVDFFGKLGFDAFVLDYRVKPYSFPVPVLDARRAVRVIRNHAKELGINENKILVMGSSAGGHLAAFLSTYEGKIDGEGIDEIDKIDCKPNGQILCYPVIEPIGHLLSFKNFSGGREELFESLMPSRLVNANTPPAFMWHTARDQSVNVINTLNYAKALKEHDVSCEMHIFPDGKHSLALSLGEDKISKHVHSWVDLLVKWLKYMNFCEVNCNVNDI